MQAGGSEGVGWQARQNNLHSFAAARPRLAGGVETCAAAVVVER